MSFYRREHLTAIDGNAHFQAQGNGTMFASETLLGILRARRPGHLHEAPILGVFVPWATQIGDIDWEDIRRPTADVILYALSDRDLLETERAAGGHQVGSVAVLARRLARPGIVEGAFGESPYELDRVECVYLSTDGKSVPTPLFLYTARLGQDVGGGRESLEHVAKRLGGRLVFPMPVPHTTGREHPELSYQLVRDSRRDVTDVKAAAGLGRVMAVSGLGEDPAPRQRGMLVGAAVLMTAGWVFWRTVRPEARAEGRLMELVTSPTDVLQIVNAARRIDRNPLRLVGRFAGLGSEEQDAGVPPWAWCAVAFAAGAWAMWKYGPSVKASFVRAID